MNLTWGGIPESEAFSWEDPTVGQAFGEIVLNLYSTDKKVRRQGYIDFYEFKRHFLVEEWDRKIAVLDEYRAGLSKGTIEDLLYAAREDLTEAGICSLYNEEAKPADLIQPKPVQKEFEFVGSVQDIPLEQTVQLSLF
jgi:hypothetical protein